MKKRVSVLLTMCMMFQMILSVNVRAAGMTEFYADIYGIFMEFDSKVSNDVIAGYSLMLGDEEIDTGFEIDGQNVKILPVEKLKTDETYSLVMGETVKNFQIKTLFFEDFNGETGSVDDTTVKENEYGAYTLVPSEGEMFYQDGEFVLANSVLSITEINELYNNRKVTYSMDVKGYGKKYTETSKPNAGLVQIFMGIRGQHVDSNKEEYALRLTNAKGYLGSVDSDSKFTAISSEFYGADNEKYGFSTVTNNEVLIGGNYTYDTESKKKEMSLRTYDNDITAFADGKVLTSITDNTYENGYFNIYCDQRTLAVVDNILITCMKEEMKAESLEHEIGSLKLKFDNSVAGVENFDKIRVYENDKMVNAEFSVDADEDTVITIIPENFKASSTYKIEVEEGFGGKDYSIFEKTEFSADIDLQEIKVIGAEVDIIDNIVIDFNLNVESVADLQSVKVYENEIEVNADKKITDNQLVIKPENFLKGNTYKVVIEKGFVNENLFVFDEYVFEETLTKRNLKALELKIATSSIAITFNEKLPEVDNIGEYIKVFLKDEEVAVKNYKIVNEKITLELSGTLEKDTEYDLYIKKGMEDENIYMKKSYLYKIKNSTPIKENEPIVSAFKIDEETSDGVLNGQFRIKNYSDDNIPVAVAVAAYGKDGKMQTARVFDISEIESGEISDIEFSLDKVSKVGEVRIFVWESLGTLKFIDSKAADDFIERTELTLPDLISDHMLIQQNKPIKIWGNTESGVSVSAKLKNGASALSEGETTAGANGEFSVELPAVTAGGPYTLSITAGNATIDVEDVLVGELWVQGGQSNMARATSGTGTFASQILPNQANEEIRLFMATDDIKATTPAKDLKGTWKIADKSSVNSYSAVGYVALEKLNEELDIPVGGICNAIGGASMSQFMGVDNGKAGEYYNTKTAPLTQLNIKGVMWYQGEGDRGRTPSDFSQTFNKLIKTWRNGWNDSELPFVYVALPPSPMKYFANWNNSYIMEDFSSARLGQLQSYYENDNVAIAVSMDCPPNQGEDALHPNNKKPIGERLGLAALDLIYNEIDNGISPLYGSASANGNTAVITFNHSYDGLKTTDGKAPRCFYVSESENGTYYEATAEITGTNTVKLTCDEVAEIKYVSYAVEMHMYPYTSVDNSVINTYADVNLVNSEGLPACPFAYSVSETRAEKN